MRRLKDLYGLRGLSMNKNLMFSHLYRENIVLILQKSNYMTNSTV
jgi:hypothetical protein